MYKIILCSCHDEASACAAKARMKNIGIYTEVIANEGNYELLGGQFMNKNDAEMLSDVLIRKGFYNIVRHVEG